MGMFSAVERMGRKSFRTPLRGFGQLSRGKFSEAFKTWKSMPGEANRSASKIAGKAGIRGWVGKHPNESIGALIAMIYGGWAAAGAYGGGAAGAGGASAAGVSGAAAGGSGAAASGGGGGIMSSIGGMFGGGGSGASTAGGTTASSGGGMFSGLTSMFGGGGGSGEAAGGGVSKMGMFQGGMSMLNSMGSFFGQQDQAAASEEAQKKQWKYIMENTREQYRQLGQQQSEANREYRNELLQNQVSLAQQRGAVELMAGASGVGGNSVASLLGDLSAQGGRNQSQIVNNYENQQAGFSNMAKAIQQGGQMEQRSFDKPSAVNSLLQGVTSAASSYSQGAQMGNNFSNAWNNSRSYSSSLN